MATFNLPHDGVDGSPSLLSAWEKLLLSAGVPESGCISLVAGSTRTGIAIRSWVLANYATRYVPERILEVLGLDEQVVRKWHSGEGETEFSMATRTALYSLAASSTN